MTIVSGLATEKKLLVIGSAKVLSIRGSPERFGTPSTIANAIQTSASQESLSVAPYNVWRTACEFKAVSRAVPRLTINPPPGSCLRGTFLRKRKGRQSASNHLAVLNPSSQFRSSPQEQKPLRLARA